MTVETWKRIAARLGRSVRWCKARASSMPVFKVGGVVCGEADELDAWLRRQRRPWGGRERA